MYAIRSYYERRPHVTRFSEVDDLFLGHGGGFPDLTERRRRITSYNVCYTKLLRARFQTIAFFSVDSRNNTFHLGQNRRLHLHRFHNRDTVTDQDLLTFLDGNLDDLAGERRPSCRPPA